MVNPKTYLIKLQKNLNILKEREAKFAGNVPLDLLNQIEDHEQAIVLTEQAIRDEITEVEWNEALKPLLVSVENAQVIIDQQSQQVETQYNVAGNLTIVRYGHPSPESETSKRAYHPFEPKTVLIPAGSFLMGSPPGEGVPSWETPQYTVELPAYRIGKYPVTNEQFAVYIQKTGKQINPAARWEGNQPPPDKLDHPVMGVTWYDALDYCQWLTKETGRDYTLPTEEQWERAARGSKGHIFPWGNEWLDDCCNHSNNQTTAVTKYPAGVSPEGCFDLVGNVGEWTRTIWGKDRFVPEPRFKYPRTPDPLRDNLAAPAHLFRVYRGGSYADTPDQLRGSTRQSYDPTKPGPHHKRLGFRVVLNI